MHLHVLYTRIQTHKFTYLRTHACVCVCVLVKIYMCVCISIYGAEGERAGERERWLIVSTEFPYAVVRYTLTHSPALTLTHS